MIVGYARTSTLEQVAGIEAQLRDLAGAGVEKVFREQVSSVAARAQLDAALDFIREGDVFMVCSSIAWRGRHNTFWRSRSG
jgi:DNA invertase Pin-like site-specific DNA recombinase